MIPGALNPMLLGGGAGSYQIQRSLLLRASAMAYLNRTFGAPTLNNVWTFSGLVKRGIIGSGVTQVIFCGDANNAGYDMFLIRFDADSLQIYQTAGAVNNLDARTVKLFRDPSAHYHIAIVYNSNEAISTDRLKIYVNGELQSLTYATGPVGSGVASQLNVSGRSHQIGRLLYATTQYFDGYLSEFRFVDGQALAVTKLGQIDPVTGQWTAIRYTGTHGANGFYLPFTNTSSPTNLCLDDSGNGNNFTPNNISTTAGATYDSMQDVPRAYGTTDRGNYCTPNPLQTGSYLTLSNGNLTVTGNTATNSGVSVGTQAFSTGMLYWEEDITTLGSISYAAIFRVGAYNGAPLNDAETCISSNNNGAYWRSGGNYAGFGSTSPTVSSFTTGDAIRVALDLVNGALYMAKGATWQNGGVPTSGAARTGALSTWTPGTELIAPAFCGYNGSVTGVNLGQRPFAYTPPTGFKAPHTGIMTSDTVITSGTFTGNLSATIGPVVWMNGAPETLTINGNAVTWGTHADKTAGGFKVRSSSSSYNNTGSNTWVATILSPSLKSSFRNQLAKVNP